MTGTQNETVQRAMRELRLAPETVADAVLCRGGREVILVLNSSKIVSWTPDGTTWPVYPSAAGPLGDGGLVEQPPRCEEARLIESRRWRVKVLEAGWGPWPFPTERAEEVATKLPGTPVCVREDFAHEPMAAVKARRAADPRTIVGTVEWAEFIDPHLGAEIRITSPRVHEALLLHHTLSPRPLAVSVVADVTTEPAVIYRRNAWGARVSEGLAECVARVGTIYSLDLVSRALAGGRLLMPVTAPVVEIREARVVESCAAVFALWPTDRVSEANGAVWKARIVKFGRSLNGWVWTKQSGEALVSHLQYAPVGVYRYDNGAMAHASEEAQVAAKGVVVRNVVGHLDQPSVETDGVYARLHVHEDAGWLKQKLSGLARMGSALGKVLGLSVDVLASYTPEGGGRAITDIRRLHSVDVVSSPSADGRIVRELEVA